MAKLEDKTQILYNSIILPTYLVAATLGLSYGRGNRLI